MKHNAAHWLLVEDVVFLRAVRCLSVIASLLVRGECGVGVKEMWGGYKKRRRSHRAPSQRY